MAILTFCLVLAVALILGTMFVLFNKANTLSYAIKCFAPLSSLVLALVAANLSSYFGGYTIFVCLGLGTVVAIENYAAAQKEDSNVSLLSAMNLFSVISFVIAGVLLAKFNVFALGLGALLGTSVACGVMIFKKVGKVQGLLVCFNIIAAFTMLGQGVALLMSETLLPSIIFAITSVLIISNILIKLFGKGKACTMIANALRMLSLITIAASIYFL